jgi:hypothetical protein
MTRNITLRLLAVASMLAGVAGCSRPAVVESSATAVTVRYGSMDGIDEATQLALKACAIHHKTARLRSTANFGLSERYGHFDCV